MQKLISYFFGEFNQTKQTLWFKRLLHVFLIIKSIYWLSFFNLFFGANSIVFKSHQWLGNTKDVVFLFYHDASGHLIFYALILLLALCLFQIIYSKLYFIGDLFIWFIVVNLNNAAYPTLTGGDHLLAQYLIFNCFLSSNFVLKAGSFSAIKRALHNVAVLAVMIQLCFVYFLSGLAKFSDLGWLSGSAISTITLIDHFSMWGTLKNLGRFGFIALLTNYVVLFYQLLFPVFIWIKTIKKPLLIVGILMHLYIALFMGIVEFAAIMILGYLYFWPQQKEKPVS